MNDPINPITPDPNVNPINPSPSPNKSEGFSPLDQMFARMFPNAPPDDIKRMANSFFNSVISSIKQDQQNFTEALKKLQEDDQDS